MTAEDVNRAKLYARSAAYAEAAGNPKLAATFTRRGIAVAGDHWPAVVADRDRDGVTNQLPEAPPAAEPTKAERDDAAALAHVCHKCGAGSGERCKNYKGAFCAPHAGRGKAVQE